MFEFFSTILNRGVLLYYRCYNCGEFANHIAAKCQLGPQPKRCHNCKSEDHLIAACPTRTERQQQYQRPPGEQKPPEQQNGEGPSSSRDTSGAISDGTPQTQLE